MGVTVEQDNNQDNTDYEKTVEKIARDEQKGTLVAVLGAFGGRMDQTLQVISSTLRMCR
jgi:thiamine pyrophosphokinase